MGFLQSMKISNTKKKAIEGQVFRTNQCGDAKVVKYFNSRQVLIEFISTHNQRMVSFHNLQNGKVLDVKCVLNTPSKYGVGVIGEGPYSHASHPKTYDAWINMLQRCYSPLMLKRESSYVGCSVCQEWLNFQQFASWYIENCPNDTYCLDKDIKIKNNKVYSPDTVLFVPSEINKLFVKQQTQRGSLPIGVQKPNDEIGFIAVCMNPFTKKAERLGHFLTPELAFYAYKEYKELIIRKMAEKYKSVISSDLYKAMLMYQVDIND